MTGSVRDMRLGADERLISVPAARAFHESLDADSLLSLQANGVQWRAVPGSEGQVWQTFIKDPVMDVWTPRANPRDASGGVWTLQEIETMTMQPGGKFVAGQENPYSMGERLVKEHPAFFTELLIAVGGSRTPMPPELKEQLRKGARSRAEAIKSNLFHQGAPPKGPVTFPQGTSSLRQVFQGSPDSGPADISVLDELKSAVPELTEISEQDRAALEEWLEKVIDEGDK